MIEEFLRVLEPGLGATIQAGPRVGWKRYGVPTSGPMDAHASSWANRLLENPPAAPVLELGFQGGKLAVVRDGWLAVTGADASATVATWRAVPVRKGDRVEFPRNRSGVWIYVAVAGGFAVPSVLGSASSYPRAGLGVCGEKGLSLARAARAAFQLPAGVAARVVPSLERRNYAQPPPLRVWPGPQHGDFSATARAQFFAQSWQVSSASDRVGYRLLGQPLDGVPAQGLSEPMRMGTIQVPENGLPMVTMRDGPTVGGYAKLGWVNPEDLSWLAQCRAGQEVTFRAVDDHGS